MNKGAIPGARQAAFLLIALFTVSAGQSAPAADVYTWSDENGVVHFSDTKPAATDAQTIQMEASAGGVSYSDPVTRPSEAPAPVQDEASLSAAQQRRQDIAEKRQARLELAAETEVMCERHSKRLEQMEPARRVYYTDENGQEVRMDDTQRVALIEESRNYVAENCH